MHEEYAVQRWPETKRLLGLLVNSAGGAHARNARRLVQAARTQDRRLQAALLAAAVAHTPEAEEVLRGARTRLSRKPGSLSRELLRNFPKGKGRRGRRRRKKTATPGAGQRAKSGGGRQNGEVAEQQDGAGPGEQPASPAEVTGARRPRRRRAPGRRRPERAAGLGRRSEVDLAGVERRAPAARRARRRAARAVDPGGDARCRPTT